MPPKPFSIRPARSLLKNLFSRRNFLGVSTAAAAGVLATTRAHAQPQDSASDPGPNNRALQELFPSANAPPPTDHALPPNFWSSFSMMHRRVQEGGWSRQVNVEDLPISQDIAGVNMRLTAGGIRELHWHEADEWALMLHGSCRLTAVDADGGVFVDDVQAGDLWYFPTGIPHSLQGLGPDGCEFLLVFDDGKFSEDNTTLLSDWMIHTPPEVVAKNWSVAQSALDPFKTIPRDGRYIFQAPVPGGLEQDRSAAINSGHVSAEHFTFPMQPMQPQKSDRSGEVRIVDSSNFAAAKNIAMAHVTIKPGGMRELHWHPNANEWQYYIAGRGRMTVFFNKSAARTIDFNPGDVGYVPQTLGHYIENTGDSDLVFLEMFKAPRYQDISLNQWLTHLPPQLVLQHLAISPETLQAIPKVNAALVPG
ncbi:Oxalate decarboxylase [Bradyrhizobium sp. ORS 375]|uniref:cupin domain-containing protein n=1 Tax=Bradyrhizobium sp. (strain ORS 375) TaxID=566679 RepID=UPI0002406F54|nr:cupin domain-containing protein [Bradyrhizobium sp. ORS 375]CCD94916.1 Oxalate decarboxylase [Bradyrhizobium sp. ORS 375]